MDEAEREVARLREQQRALGAVLRALARAEGLQPVLAEIVQAATDLSGAEHGQLYLADGGLLHVWADTPGPAGQDEAFEYGREHPHVHDRTTIVGRVALSAEVEQIPDVLADDDYTYGAQELVGYRALLGVPILSEGELIGAMALGRNTPGPFSDEQIDVVLAFADQAAVAIANARLLEAVDRQRTELARFVSPQVAALISSPEGEQLLGGHRAYISCLFCDLRNFTGFAETAAPEDLIEVLRQYHGAIGALIPAHGGTLEHFAGDGVMIFFNDPVPVENHELEAVKFALAFRDRFEELADGWRRRLGADLAFGIGIEAGHATLGRIGFDGRYDYGVLGPLTNLAARLSTNAGPGQVLIGPRLSAAVDEQVECRKVGDLELKGFTRPVATYEVDALRRPQA